MKFDTFEKDLQDDILDLLETYESDDQKERDRVIYRILGKLQSKNCKITNYGR